MELQRIKDLVKQGESDQVEFKRKVKHPEKIVREMVAFANTKGGHLLIGVDDNGSVPGVKFVDEEQFLMEKAIRELSRPRLVCEVNTVSLSESRAVLHYYIPSSAKKPHYALEKPKQRWGQAYIRKADKSLQASREVCAILKGQKKEAGQGFAYGDNEKKLMNYLGNHEYVTVKEYANIAGISLRHASDILIQLTLSKVLKIIPREQEDWFEFVEKSI